MDGHCWWYRWTWQCDAVGAKEWMQLLLNKMWEDEMRAYIDKMCEDALGNYDFDFHNCTLGDIFDEGIMPPCDEDFFKELKRLVDLYDVGEYEKLPDGLNHLFLILLDYRDDWNLCGTESCPLDDINNKE